eukprot:2565555-Pyramimonas_sp.AAC.1
MASGAVFFSTYTNGKRNLATATRPEHLRTNRRRGGGIYPTREPIAGGEAVYTQRKNQSQEGRRCIRPSARTNRRREDGIYPA